MKNDNKKLVKNNKIKSRYENSLVLTKEDETPEEQKPDHEKDSNQNIPPPKSLEFCSSSINLSPSFLIQESADSYSTSPATPPRTSPSTTLTETETRL